MYNYCEDQEIITDPIAVIKEELAKMSTTELLAELGHYENMADIHPASSQDGIVGLCELIISEISTRRVSIEEVN